MRPRPTRRTTMGPPGPPSYAGRRPQPQSRHRFPPQARRRTSTASQVATAFAESSSPPDGSQQAAHIGREGDLPLILEDDPQLNARPTVPGSVAGRVSVEGHPANQSPQSSAGSESVRHGLGTLRRLARPASGYDHDTHRREFRGPRDHPRRPSEATSRRLLRDPGSASSSRLSSGSAFECWRCSTTAASNHLGLSRRCRRCSRPELCSIPRS